MDHGHGHHWQPGATDADTEAGIRSLKLSLVGLALTAALQGTVAAVSGSVGLLGDTFHNVADALTALPLWFAYGIGRRPRNRRYTHGYGRAEDLAGIFVVLVIAATAAFVGCESIRRLLDPREVEHVGAVAAAAMVGFAGNELVAQHRIRTGRRIASAALVADGLHARADGFTSLAVLAGVIGVAAGWDEADPVAGLVITAAILWVLKEAATSIYQRLMDAVDPSLVDEIAHVLHHAEGVESISDIRVRWIGHQLRAEVEIVVDQDTTVVEGHEVANRAEHRLLHDVSHLSSAVVHVSPCGHNGTDHHADLRHHEGAQ